MVSGYKDELMFSKVGDALLYGKVATKLLVIIVDLSLTFNHPVEIACTTISNFTTKRKRKFDSNFCFDIDSITVR